MGVLEQIPTPQPLDSKGPLSIPLRKTIWIDSDGAASPVEFRQGHAAIKAHQGLPPGRNARIWSWSAEGGFNKDDSEHALNASPPNP